VCCLVTISSMAQGLRRNTSVGDIRLDQRREKARKPMKEYMRKAIKREGKKREAVVNDLLADSNVSKNTCSYSILAQVQQSFAMIAVSTTVTPAAQQLGGAAHTQQSLQVEDLLTTMSAAAAPAAPIVTTSITGPPFHPNFSIRRPGLWTRFICCVSAEVTDDHH
jgi:hypothetical protein